LAAHEAKANEKTTPSVRKNMINRFDKDFWAWKEEFNSYKVLNNYRIFV
jgi:hypothetical protein